LSALYSRTVSVSCKEKSQVQPNSQQTQSPKGYEDKD
jgi:hypothetical protein